MSLARFSDTPALLITRLDPRSRIIGAVFCVLAAVSMTTTVGQIGMIIAALALATFADVNWRDMLHRLAHVEGFMVVLLILLPLSVDGRTFIAFGPLALSETGLMRALAIVLKVNASVIATMALLATLEPVRLGRGMATAGNIRKNGENFNRLGILYKIKKTCCSGYKNNIETN